MVNIAQISSGSRSPSILRMRVLPIHPDVPWFTRSVVHCLSNSPGILKGIWGRLFWQILQLKFCRASYETQALLMDNKAPGFLCIGVYAHGGREVRSGDVGVGSVVWRRCLGVTLYGSFQWMEHPRPASVSGHTYWGRSRGPGCQSGSSAKVMMEFLSLEIFWSVKSWPKSTYLFAFYLPKY